MAIIDKIQLSGTVYTIGNETTTAVTSASTDNEIPTAKAVYDAIPQGSGGKAIEAGTNISITTGETSDTINCTLPISGGTGTNALIYNSTINVASGDYSHSEGYISKAEGYASHAEGLSTKSKGFGSHAEGYFTITTNESEHSSGRYNNSVSSSTTFGDSGNTLLSVGNGTADNARHNAFEIRQNGDIYIADTNDTSTTNHYEKPMIKLQDALGGGGSSYTAGDGIDISNDVISVTGKVDTSAFTAHTADTVIHVTSDEKAAWNGKQDTLVSGTNIKTINNQSILGEGNITIEGGSGGGKAIEAGRGISITTGETADTVSFNLPISAGTYSFHNSIRIGNANNTASGSRSFAGGEGCTASSTDSFSFGLANTASSTGATAFGFKTKADVNSSFVCGKWNDIANANTGENFGDSGNTLFAVGNGWKQNDWTSGTANTHNAIDIRQNGDIYIADTNDTSTTNFYEKPMIKLQDALGGGGSSYTAGDGIDISNNVISVTGKVDTSSITTSVTSSSTDSQVPSAKAVNDKLGGLSIVKLTQSEYDSITTKDNSTLYVIVN